MDKAKIMRLCKDEISEAWNNDAIETDTAGHIASQAQKIAAEISAKPVSEPCHAYWIPTECGVKCSECGTEYADTDYPEKMYQCPHCYSQMGEPRKLTNGDKIRAMTDEELVMALYTDCNRCAKSENCELFGDPVSYGICVKGNIAWLKQEVSEDAGAAK